MATQTTLHSLADYEALPRDLRCELVKGELRELTFPRLEHSRVQGNLIWLIRDYLHRNPIGQTGAEYGFVLERDPDTLRGPDVYFIRNERLALIEDGAWMEGAPDLAIEILSPSNRRRDIHEKIAQYFRAGAQLVWVVDPDPRVVYIHRADAEVQVATESLEAADLLPGLKIDLREIFNT